VITSNSPRTIEAWAYTESFNNGGIFQAGTNNTNNEDFSLKTTWIADQWRMQFSSGNYVTVNLTGSQNSWHHYALSYDGSTAWLYFDGELAVEQNIALNTVANNLYLGYWNNYYFDGKIDEVCVWDVCRTEQEIRENMYISKPLDEPGLVSRWKFNEAGGSILIDFVSNNEGTLINMEEEDWVISTIPFGNGVSYTQAEALGIVDFTNTGLSMEFVSVGVAEITVTRIDTTANVNPDGLDEVFDQPYWIVNRYGSGSFRTDLTFTLTDALTIDDENDPMQGCLFNRASYSDQAWVYLTSASSVNSATDEATFEGITDFSQFIIGRGQPNIDPPENVTILTTATEVQLTWDEVENANSYKILASDSPDGIFVDVTSEGTFGRSENVILSLWKDKTFSNARKLTKTPTHINRVSVTEGKSVISTKTERSRATQTWTAPLTNIKKFYYVKALTETSRSLNKHSDKIKQF